MPRQSHGQAVLEGSVGRAEGSFVFVFRIFWGAKPSVFAPFNPGVCQQSANLKLELESPEAEKPSMQPSTQEGQIINV